MKIKSCFKRPDDHRRKWNLAEYEKTSDDEDDDDVDVKTGEKPTKRELLKARDYKVCK
jgi:hypothetical protein